MKERTQQRSMLENTVLPRFRLRTLNSVHMALVVPCGVRGRGAKWSKRHHACPRQDINTELRTREHHYHSLRSFIVKSIIRGLSLKVFFIKFFF